MTKMERDQCVKLFQAVYEHLRKSASLFPLHRQVSSASVYSNRGEKNTGKMLETMIIKLPALTGGLSGGKALPNCFIFNRLDFI